MQRFEELQRRLSEIHDVEKAAGVLSWDEETKMPPSGADVRAEQRATLNRVAHERNVSPELGELFEELRPFEEAHDFESFEASLIRIGRRDYEKAVRVPPDLRAEMTRAGSIGYQGWLRAREAEDYSIMLPHLERNLELRRRYVACFEPAGDPYDVVLDDYEPGMKTAEVEQIFDKLKAALVPWLRAVPTPIRSTTLLRGHFPREAQRRFALGVLGQWGTDRAAWRLDRTVHPFATSFGPTDIV
jgi:carboxypeptidase Taq